MSKSLGSDSGNPGSGVRNPPPEPHSSTGNPSIPGVPDGGESPQRCSDSAVASAEGASGCALCAEIDPSDRPCVECQGASAEGASPAPCRECGKGGGSACPLCGGVLCSKCAREGVWCCDGARPRWRGAEGASAGERRPCVVCAGRTDQICHGCCAPLCRQAVCEAAHESVHSHKREPAGSPGQPAPAAVGGLASREPPRSSGHPGSVAPIVLACSTRCGCVRAGHRCAALALSALVSGKCAYCHDGHPSHDVKVYRLDGGRDCHQVIDEHGGGCGRRLRFVDGVCGSVLARRDDRVIHRMCVQCQPGGFALAEGDGADAVPSHVEPEHAGPVSVVRWGVECSGCRSVYRQLDNNKPCPQCRRVTGRIAIYESDLLDTCPNHAVMYRAGGACVVCTAEQSAHAGADRQHDRHTREWLALVNQYSDAFAARAVQEARALHTRQMAEVLGLMVELRTGVL